MILTLYGYPDAVLLSVLALPAAVAAYRVTVTKAISGVDAIDTAFARNADTLFEKLGTTKPADGAARRKKLERLSDFMLRDKPDNNCSARRRRRSPRSSRRPTSRSRSWSSRSTTRGTEPPASSAAACAFVAFATRSAAAGTRWAVDGVFVFSDDRVPRIDRRRGRP